MALLWVRKGVRRIPRLQSVMTQASKGPPLWELSPPVTDGPMADIVNTITAAWDMETRQVGYRHAGHR